jgi:hypothetical protein
MKPTTIEKEPEKSLPIDTQNPTESPSESNIKTNEEISEKPTKFSDTNTVTESVTSNVISETESEILLNETSNISIITETELITNSLITKLKVYLFGYENYRYFKNRITFRIYFTTIIEGNNPVNITYMYFTLSIRYSNYIRKLEEMNLIAHCTLDEERKDLLEYNCEASPEQEINITGISLNFDFAFIIPIDLSISPLALLNKDKLMERTGDTLHSKKLIILTGDLIQDKDYFSIKGELDNNYKKDNKFNLTIYNDQGSAINSSCQIVKEVANNIEIKCNKNNLENIDGVSINNSVSYMTYSMLLVKIKDGQDDYLYKANDLKNQFFFKSEKKLKTSVVIAIIIVAILIIAIIVGIILFLRNNKSRINNNTNSFDLINYNLKKLSSIN